MQSRRFEHWFHPAATLAMPDLDVASLSNGAVREIASAFLNNIEQLREAALTPLLLVVYARAQQSVIDQACISVFGDLQNRSTDDPRIEEFNGATRDNWIRWQEANESPEAFGERIFLAAGELDQLQDVHPSVSRGLEATLRGVVLGAWTAFEVLASDLWEAAVNAHPKTLASLRGDVSVRSQRSKRSFGAFPNASDDASATGKHIRLDFLQANDFNLSNMMGTVLRERFNFQILTGIQKAYLAAFALPESPVRRVIRDPAIVALASTRNLLAHRSAKVDQQFMSDHSQVPMLKSIFPDATLGSHLKLSGLNTYNLIQPVLSLAVELIQGVSAIDNEGK